MYISFQTSIFLSSSSYSFNHCSNILIIACVQFLLHLFQFIQQCRSPWICLLQFINKRQAHSFASESFTFSIGQAPRLTSVAYEYFGRHYTMCLCWCFCCHFPPVFDNDSRNTNISSAAGRTQSPVIFHGNMPPLLPVSRLATSAVSFCE